MRICLLVEGSYPYVVGGVSSWVQMLIEGLPEHEFVVYSIGAEMKQRGDFRYNLPKNLVEVHELFLDEILALRAPSRNEKPLTPQEKVCLYELVVGNVPLDLDVLLGIFRSDRIRHDAMGIFMSADFFDIIERVYREHYDHLPFTDFFWTIRSMLLPLFYILQQDFPEADIYHSVATGYCGVVGGVASRVYRKPFLITEHGIYSREREEEILKCKWAEGDFKSVWIQYFYNLAGLAYAGADRVFTLFQKNADTEIALGCAPEKIAIGHIQRNSDQCIQEQIVGLGAYVELDGTNRIKYVPDNARVDLIKTLGAKGYGRQTLLGTDSGKASYQKAYGSVSGIDYDPAVFCPRLIDDEGFDPDYVQDLLVNNAATFFAFEPLQG